MGTKNEEDIVKDLAKIVGGLLDHRALVFERMEQNLKAPNLSNIEHHDLIALVCVYWFAVLGRMVKIIDKPEENWRTILTRGNSLMDNLSPRIFALLSFGNTDPNDLRFIVHRSFCWMCCYGELVKRVNAQDHYRKCNFCDYKATGIIELRVHSERNHSRLFTEIKKFAGKFERCKYCPPEALKVPNMTEHLRESHPEALEWKQKPEPAKKAKEVVFPPRAGKDFALSLWKDEELNKAVVHALLAHIWIRREKIPETIKRQRDLKPEVLYPGTIEKAWSAYQKVAAQYEGMVDVPPWPNQLPTDRGLLWDAVIEWLYFDSVRQMLGIYGPVLDFTLEKAFDDDIIDSKFSPVRPTQMKKVPYLKEVNQNSQPHLFELDAVQEKQLDEWVRELQSIPEKELVEKLLSAASDDPNPQALPIIQDLLQGDRKETVAKRYGLDPKTIRRILDRITASSNAPAK